MYYNTTDIKSDYSQCEKSENLGVLAILAIYRRVTSLAAPLFHMLFRKSVFKTLLRGERYYIFTYFKNYKN